MDTTKAQQKALDDALVAPENRLMIRKCNQRLSSTLKSNEPTIQVALDALKLTPFYNAFEVFADVPEIYMQEFWATVTKHHYSLRFKLNGKSHTLNVDNFRDMLKICPKLLGQKLEEPPFEEEILSHKRSWTYCGKTTGLERLRLSLENKDSKKNNDMFYPRFTKVIVDYFMAKDPSISRRNKMFWHTAKDDSMFTTIRVISKHQDTQIYDANLPQHLTNQAMLESEAYKTYHEYATGEKTPKPKKKKADSESSPKEKPGDGVDTLSKVLDEQPQKKSGTDEGAGDKPEVPNVPKYNSNSEEESWTFSDGDDDEDVNEDSDAHDDSDENESDDKGNDFVHPNLSTYTPNDQDEEENAEDEEKAEDDEDMIDAGMTEAHATKDTEDANVNLTAVTHVVQQQSSSVSDLVSKFINPSTDEVTATTKIPPTMTTTYQPSTLNIHSFQTPVTTTLTTFPTITFPEIPNFASLFGFDQRVTVLESELSMLKKSNPFTESISSIPGIVDKYLATKIKEAVDVAVQLKSDKLREKAQAKNQDFINSLDSNMTKIIKQ
ncbi:hypothetical protein Tco_1126693 [Tanacetum coccineum]